MIEWGLIHEWNDTYKVILFIAIVVFVFPICLIKNLTGLRYFSLLGFIGVFYTAFVIFKLRIILILFR